MKPQTKFSGQGFACFQVVQGQYFAGLGILQAEEPGARKMEVIRFDRLGHLGQVKGPVGFEIQGLRLNAA